MGVGTKDQRPRTKRPAVVPGPWSVVLGPTPPGVRGTRGNGYMKRSVEPQFEELPYTSGFVLAGENFEFKRSKDQRPGRSLVLGPWSLVRLVRGGEVSGVGASVNSVGR
jgi:hypothetical protein